jgi:septum formation protein
MTPPLFSGPAGEIADAITDAIADAPADAHTTATRTGAPQRLIVLASTSPYRRELLARLGLAFEVAAPGVDELPLAGEGAARTAERLARAKSAAVAATRLPDGSEALVIGSDQVAECAGRRLDKPGNFAVALEQLGHLSGREATFHTAVAVTDTASGRCLSRCVATTVRYRQLPTARLAAYLERDQPWDCAGASRIEGLGIALVESMHCTDPTALIGLPLIALTALLDELGLPLPIATTPHGGAQ